MNRDEIDQLVATCGHILQSGKSVEHIISFLREHTGRKTVSIAVVARLLNISVGEAKSLVHAGKTWSDVRECDEAYEQSVVTALEQLNTEQEV